MCCTYFIVNLVRQLLLLAKIQCFFGFGQIVDIMRVNVERVIERDEKLTDLDGRAGNYNNNNDINTSFKM